MEHEPHGRELLDPQGRYPADGLLLVEDAALQMMSLLPDVSWERTREVFQFTEPGEDGLTVLVTREAVEIRLFTIEWTRGAYGPAPSSYLWRRIESHPYSLQIDAEEMSCHLAEARRARRDEYVRCCDCGELTPPERRIQSDLCHRCAERQGVCF